MGNAEKDPCGMKFCEPEILLFYDSPRVQIEGILLRQILPLSETFTHNLLI